MNPPQPDVKALFNEALDRPDGPDRLAYLDQACSENPALRSQLETLLKAHDEAGGFLATVDHAPMSTVTVRPPSILEGPGTTVGPYKLLQQIGEGGMGVVFMAEQTHPVRRKVALKVIKPGMDTSQVVARFEAERQALAIMDHPNIARVLDVGATATGRPFFVMELVKGVPITEYCDRNHLTPKERLELFMPVCRAIQHAHQKGIIHRDIKPSNVLVTLHDGQPVPKVIDFGVAKAIDQRLTERTMFTEFGAVIGTLEYMSPEQAEMGALDIDTRSDIYSLGVLLYELLTGSTPLERAKLRQAAFSEVLRRIREEEPTKPSTRLSESNEALPSISAQRKMEPARLTKLVKGDLDWIVMKSLEKDRTRRYETATGFARDIQRYLDGDAVEACPPSVVYKFRKFARKHRTAIVTVGSFLFLLITATAISFGLAYWANRERVRANRERDRAVIAEKQAEEQRKKIEAVNKALDDQRKRAEANEQQAIEAVKKFGDVISKEPELKQNPALEGLRKRLLNESLDFFKTLRNQLQKDKETTPESLARLGSASFELGHLTNEIGDQRDALRAFEQSLAIRERLTKEHPSVSQFQADLAWSHHRIGLLKKEAGQQDEALVCYRDSLTIWQTLDLEHPGAQLYRSQIASVYNDIGLVMNQTGRPADAIESFRKAMVIYEGLARKAPDDLAIQHALAVSHHNIGVMQEASGRLDEAIESARKALEINIRLAGEHSSVARFQSDLARSYYNMALLEVDRPSAALSSTRKSLAILERLAQENPTVTEYQMALALSYSFRGSLSYMRPFEAIPPTLKAATILERLALENPSVTDYQSELAVSYDNLGYHLRMVSDPTDAYQSYLKALPIRERLVREHPESPDFASKLGGTLNNLATIELSQWKFENARSKLKQAIKWQRKALAANPDHPLYRQLLANHLKSLIQADESLGIADEATQDRLDLNELYASDPAELARETWMAAVRKGQTPNTPDAKWAQLAFGYRLTVRQLQTVESFTNKPKISSNTQGQPSYNAACSAALAACGHGNEASAPADADRIKLRSQALEWLKAELAMWGQVFDKAPPQVKAQVSPTLQHWKEDSDLISIRDEKELAKLPEAEREAFRQLWAEVDQLLARASSDK
jgi:serine/threonine protein kinase/tetratricopeptide (TPR) repeat protein